MNCSETQKLRIQMLLFLVIHNPDKGHTIQTITELRAEANREIHVRNRIPKKCSNLQLDTFKTSQRTE